MADFGVQLPRESKPAPEFTLPALEGMKEFDGRSRVSLQAMRGHVVILHFWATWCVPCRNEMPRLAAFWERARKRGVIVLAVNVDRGHADHVAEYMAKLGLKLPVLLDADGRVRNRYHVRMLPMTYLIGRDGRMLGRIFGERDWTSDKAYAMLEAMLEERPQ